MLEPIEAFERVNGVRLGVVYCNAGKAMKELGWSAELGLEEMCRDAYAQPQGVLPDGTRRPSAAG